MRVTSFYELASKAESEEERDLSTTISINLRFLTVDQLPHLPQGIVSP